MRTRLIGSLIFAFCLLAQTMASAQAPTVATYSPRNGAANVATGQSLVLTFTAAVKKGASGSITVRNGASVVETIGITNAAVTVAGAVVTIIPPVSFPKGRTLSVQVAAGSLLSSTDVAYVGIADTTTWRFTTDGANPTISQFTPAANALNIATDANLTFRFSEKIRKGTGSITIRNGAAVVETINAATAPAGVLSVTSDSIVTINPVGDFPSSAQISIAFEAGVFEDLSANKYAGNAASPWTFQVADIIPPARFSFAPANGAANVLASTNLTLVFSEKIRKGVAGNIVIRNNGVALETIAVATAPAGVLSVTSDSIVTINPALDLPPAAVISIIVEAGAFADLTGNPYAGNAADPWAFGIDNVKPTVVTGSLAPANGAVNVPVAQNLTFRFSEKVRKGAGSITIRNGAAVVETINAAAAPAGVLSVTNDSIVTINPALDFPSGGSMSVSFAADVFEDLSGNKYDGNTASPWTFRAADIILPVVVPGSFIPANGASRVAVDASPTFRFSKKIRRGTGSITIRNGAAVVETINAATAPAGVLSVTSDSIVTINPVGDFPSSAQISIAFAAGVFEDLSGNKYDGNTASPWTFQVADVAKPVAILYEPADNSNEVAANAVLRITFSKPVRKGGIGAITIAKGNVNQGIQIGNPAISVMGNVVTITPPTPLPLNTYISIQITPGALLDTANNAYEGISDTITWNFRTQTDITRPAIARLQPRDDTANVAPDARLVMVFSERVKKANGSLLIIATGVAPQSIPVGSANVVVSGNVVTITPPLNFPTGADVYVLVLPDSFTDEVGNPFAGITDATTWNFKVADNIPPAIISLNPPNGAVNVSPAANLFLIFSEKIKKGTGSITLSQGAGNPVQTIDIADARYVTFSDNILVISPPLPLVSGAVVSVQIPGAAITDLPGNPFVGIAANAWSFTVADTQPPSIAANGLDPADNAVGVAPGKSLSITFDKMVKKGSGTITIYENGVPNSIDVGNANVVVTGKTVTLNYSAIKAGGFLPGAEVHVLVSFRAFTDLAGNIFPGISSPTDWNFTIADNTPPTITQLSPANGAANVAASTNLVLTFNEGVKAGAGAANKINIFQAATNTLLESIAANNTGKVLVTGNTVTILNSPLPTTGTEIYVIIEAAAFTDITGNAFAGYAANNQWRFRVADSNPPTVTGLNPTNNQTGVPVNAPLSMTFSEEIRKGASGSVIIISKKGAVQTVALSQITVSGSTATIPHAPFSSNDTLYVLVFPGVFTDVAGNRFDGISSEQTWRFVTSDIMPPQVVSLKPATGTTGVALNTVLEVVFDEEIKKSTGSITIYQNAVLLQTIAVTDTLVKVNGKTATIRLRSNLPVAATVSVLIDNNAFTDLTNNRYAGISNRDTWSFTTIDLNAPVITSYLPERNATNVPTNTNLRFTFNKDIQKGSGNITLSVSGTATPTVIPVANASVVVEAGRRIVDVSLAGFFPSGIPSGATVTVTMDNGVFKDVSNGNPFAGIASSDPWRFSVNDIIPPDVVSVLPADNAANVPVNATLSITFSETVKAGTGKITVYRQGNATPVAVLNANQGTGLPGITATYTLPAALPSETSLYVLIDNQAFADLANLSFAGISNPERWNFTTGDINVPVVTVYSPANKAVNVPTDQELVLTFSEAVKKGADGVVTVNNGGDVQQLNINAATFSGNTIRFNRTFPFGSGSKVFVLIPAGIITDLTGNPYAGINRDSTWSFTAIDNVKPLVTDFSPRKGATDVAPTARLSLTFSEPVKQGSGTIFISQPASNQTIAIPGAGVVFSNNNRTVTIPNANFTAGTAIVLITPGTFTDLTGNPYDGVTDWSFTVADIVVPVLVSTSPGRNEANVSPDVTILLTFSEAVRKGAGIITITPQGGVAQAIDVASAKVTVLGTGNNGTTVSIQLLENLPSGSTVSVSLPNGSFLDAENNAFGGAQWSFAVADVLPPQIASVNPADNAANVPRNTALTITFSEIVSRGVGKVSVFINKVEKAVDVQTLTPSGRTVTIALPEVFPSNAEVYVLVSDGAFKDAAGNAFRGINDPGFWNFTVEDYVAPTITDFAPKSPPDAAVNANVNLTFSEAVKRGTGSITLVQSIGGTQTISVANASQVGITGNVVTIDPSDFPSSSTVDVTIPAAAFTDLAGNAMTQEQKWTFRVVDIDAPFATALSPADDSTNVPVNAQLRLTFSKPVKKNRGLISVFVNGTARTFEVGGPEISISANQQTATINPHTAQQPAFPSGAAVYVTMPSGVFTDLSSNANPFRGIASASTWNFTVADILPPQLVTVSPANQAQNVAVNEELVITFSEAVRRGAADGAVTITQNTGTTEIVSFSDAKVRITGNTVRISHAKPFDSEANVSVQFPASALEDLSGNRLAGPVAWSFKAADVIKPSVRTLSPANGQPAVATTSPLVITFNEEIRKGTGKIILTEVSNQGGGRTQAISVASDSVRINGAQATIFHQPFLSGATVSVIMFDDVFTDRAGNRFDGFPTPESWRFDVSDILFPYIVSKIPEDEASNVIPTTDLVINFSEPMKRGTGFIILSYVNPVTGQSSGLQYKVETDLDVIRMRDGESTVTIKPRVPFPSNARVTVRIQNGCFTDLQGNKFGLENDTEWNFSIADVTDPTLAALSPANGSQNVDQNAPLTITFSEPVRAGVGFVKIFRTDNTNPILTIDVGDTARVKISRTNAKIVTIVPGITLPSGTTLNVTVDAAAFTDLAGNAFLGIPVNEWAFTVSDVVAPRVLTLRPADNARNVPPDSPLEITFTEPVVAVANRRIYIYVNGVVRDSLLATAVQFAQGRARVTLPVRGFNSEDDVYIRIPDGTFTDVAENRFAGFDNTTAWNFSIADVVAPLATQFNPRNGQTFVAVDKPLTITFNEPVKRGIGFILLNEAGGGGNNSRTFQISDTVSVKITGRTVQIIPTDGLPYRTDISVQIPEGTLTDLSGNAYKGVGPAANDKLWRFRTPPPPDFDPPLITSLRPKDDTIDVAITDDLSIVFNEPIKAGKGFITITQGTANSSQRIDIKDINITAGSNVLTINPPANLPPNTNVSVQMEAGVVVDSVGNEFQGIFNNTDWNFLTSDPSDIVPPVVQLLDPPDGTASIRVSRNFTLTFSESIRRGQGNIVIDDNGQKRNIPVGSREVTIENNRVTINPDADLTPGANVNIQIPGSAFTDLAGNRFTIIVTENGRTFSKQGIPNPQDWNFSTAGNTDITPPVVTSRAPMQGQVVAASTRRLELTFSKPVFKYEGNIEIRQGNTTTLLDVNRNNVRVDTLARKVFIDLISGFPAGATVRVTIPSSTFIDRAGNSFAGFGETNAWEFKIEDRDAPQAIMFSPAKNAGGVARNANLLLEFNEPIRIRNGAGKTVRILLNRTNLRETVALDAPSVSVSGSTLAINPAADLPQAVSANDSISILIDPDGLEDLSGNGFEGITNVRTWRFSVGAFIDNTAPKLLAASGFEPSSNRKDVDNETLLKVNFDEPVQKGSGKVRIVTDGITSVLDITDSQITVSDRQLVIRPNEAFPYFARVYVIVDKGAVTDRANNAFEGITDPTAWNFTIEKAPPVALSISSPLETVDDTARQATVIADISQRFPGITATLYYRGITTPGSSAWQPQSLVLNGLSYQAAITRAMLDEDAVGLEYYFELTFDSTLATNPVRSRLLYTYHNYTGSGLKFPGLQAGDKVTDYQIVSVPLELRKNDISEVFGDDLQLYDIKKWRLFRYGTDVQKSVEYQRGLSMVEAGAGYWLIAKNQAVLDTLDTGAGSTLRVRRESPFRMDLKRGWNQIGNPYNFNVSWEDILKQNRNLDSLAKFYAYEGGYAESTTLRRFRGGFVFSDEDVSISIPVTRRKELQNGRIGQIGKPSFAEGSLWEVAFDLQTGDAAYTLAGLGMHPLAQTGKDGYDRMALPRLPQHLDITFEHPEHFARRFTKDMVPERDDFMWEFTVASGFAPQNSILSWGKTWPAVPGKQLVLFDVQQNRAIDLTRQTEYRFWLDKSALFRVYYGSRESIGQALKPEFGSLGHIYPNPFSQTTTIPFALAKSGKPYQVRVEMYTMTGVKVATLAQGIYEAGLHETTWNGHGADGTQLPAGLYVCQLEITGENGKSVYRKKVVITR